MTQKTDDFERFISHELLETGVRLLEIRVVKDSSLWNKIVDQSPYSVLHHRYELNALTRNQLPLLIREGERRLLFPLNTTVLFRSFRLATSPIFTYASLLPENEEAIDLIPEALDYVSSILRKVGIDYLSTCAPTFWPRSYTAAMNFWFVERNASIQTIYSHIIRTKDRSFEEIWKHQFNKRARNRVRKAEREGVSVVKIDTVDKINAWIDDIHQCNLSALKRQGRWGAYPDSHKEVFLSELVHTKAYLGKHFNVYGAIYRGVLIAYFVIQEYNRLMQVGKAMSHSSFLDKYPNEALVADMVRRAREYGYHWFEYGWDRVRRKGKAPSLYPSLQRFKDKFGFEEVPIIIYRLGLSHFGRVIKNLYSVREHVLSRSASIPKPAMKVLLRIYVPRRRRLHVFSHG